MSCVNEEAFMANNPVPTLTAKGWATDMETKADMLLSYYFTSQYSQSNLYRGGISSLQYQLQQWGNNPMSLQNYLQTAISTYLSKYFDSANVLITIVDPTSQQDQRMTVQVDARVTQNGVTASLGRLVYFLNATIVSIMNMNNGTTMTLNN
jgi:hypothetical protein